MKTAFPFFSIVFASILLVACSSVVDQAEQAVPDYAVVLPQEKGAIASVNPLATAAGMDAFRKGGNAIDAALAVAFTLGVVDSHNSGIGGGCFILARLADGRIIAIDGREMAPAGAHKDMYVRDGEVQSQLSKTGALASGIPGSVAALHQLQSVGGRLQFKDVLLPAADLAETGFEIDNTLATRLTSQRDSLAQFPATASIFLDANGQALTAGTRLVQNDLAASYRALAAQGPSWFYNGEFARLTEEWMQGNGGVITREDFAAYEVMLREPVTSSFLGYSIVGFPPPSSGGTHVAQILNMLASQRVTEFAAAERTHLLAESMRRAFADRAHWLGDADAVEIPPGLISAEYAAKRIADFSPLRMTSEVAAGTPINSPDEIPEKHTTHIATADAEGNWVAITSTLNTSFGSKVVVPGTGLLLNNQMDDFSAQPGTPNAFGLIGSEANSIAPGKRPLSSMSPTLVLRDGEPVLTLGAAGGPTIISQVAQVLMYRLALGYDLEQAVAAPRIHHQWRPDLLFVEAAMPQTVKDSLQSLGYDQKDLGNFGATQAIEYNDDRFISVTEPRLIQRNR